MANMGSSFGIYNFFGSNNNVDPDESRPKVNNIFRNERCNDDSSSEKSSTSTSSESEQEAAYCQDSNLFTSQRNKFVSGSEVVTLSVIESVVEKMIDFYELISLVFLLYDNRTALQTITVLLMSGPAHYTGDQISSWARRKPKNWQNMLLEALAIIQNYEVLKKLGLSKNDVIIRFQPHWNTTLYISRVKKMLYRTIECLTPDQSKEVCRLIKVTEFTERLDPECHHLEFYLLFWSDQGEITIDAHMLMFDKLIMSLKKIKNPLITNNVSELEAFQLKINQTSSKSASRETVENSRDSTVYPIKDSKRVGLLIIINNEKFHRELKKEFQDLLPLEDLSYRDGSQKDAKNLTKTFEEMNFEVKVEENVCHNEFKQKVQNLIKNYFEERHSMLFLCVLSHGREGEVYAANSIPMSLRSIQNVVSDCLVLANKPKVFIIQACQGVNTLKCDYSKSVLDGPDVSGKLNNSLNLIGNNLKLHGSEVFFPKHADVLLCISIIEGYAAVRCPIKGSVYINEMCSYIKRYYKKEPFLDIVTRVQNKLNGKDLHVFYENGNCKEHANCMHMYMTPIKYDTLRKKLYLSNISC